MIESNIDMPSVSAEDVARILGAMGQLMEQMHQRDLTLQDAISEIAQQSSKTGLNLGELQHLDLVTQTHAELARFLPQLADCLIGHPVHHGNLVGALSLHSLQNMLLGVISEEADKSECTDPGVLSLF